MTNQNPAIAAAAKEAMKAVTKEAAKSTNKLSEKAVADAAPALEAAITKAIAADPVVQNATNTEAWFFQKRTFWGYSADILTVLVSIAGYMTDHASAELSLSVIVGAVWAGYSTWRAGRAKKPMFMPKPVPHVLSK